MDGWIDGWMARSASTVSRMESSRGSETKQQRSTGVRNRDSSGSGVSVI